MLEANDIFGTDIGTLKGKTNRRKPEKVIIDQQHTLPVDVFWHLQWTSRLYKLPFLISKSRHIRFLTIEMISKDQKAANILNDMHHTIIALKTGGLRVTSILGDGQSEALVELNISSKNEHVPEIERYIRTV